MSFETIVANKTPEKIGLIQINRPAKRNALSIRVRREISDCLNDWIEDPEVGVVILFGTGDMFSAGFDLKEFSQPDLMEEVYLSSSRYHRDVWNFPKPTIAAVEKMALGGAFDLATLCDIRICSESAQFGHPEIKFGAPPLFTPLRWIVGNAMAREICLTGRKFGAGEAYRLGLVSEVVGDGRALERAKQIAGTILEAPMSALITTKRYMTTDSGLGFEESFVNEHDKPFQAVLPQQ